MTIARQNRSVAARFSSAASTYDRFSTVQLAVASEVAERAAALGPVRTILEVGCGTGLLTQMLTARFPRARIDAIDAAEGLVHVARQRFAANSKVTCLVRDAIEFSTRRRYDLVASGSAFHWIEPLDELFRRMAGLLARDGRLVFGMMLDGTLAELRAARARVCPRKPVPARLPRPPQVLAALAAAGLAANDVQTRRFSVPYPSAADFLRAIHGVGVTGGRFSSGGSLLTRSELSALVEDYQAHYAGPDGTVRAAYKVLWATARKARPGRGRS